MVAKPPIVVLDERAVNVFTDGSSYSGPRRGGIGYRIVTVDNNGDEVAQDCEAQGFRGGTNQEMELMACIVALRDLGGRHPPVDVRRFSKVVLHTDSMYVADNFNNAKFTWPRNGWMTRDGNPVVNASLWKDFVVAANRIGKRVEIDRFVVVQWRLKDGENAGEFCVDHALCGARPPWRSEKWHRSSQRRNASEGVPYSRLLALGG